MKAIYISLRIELLKAYRSKALLCTIILFSIFPLMCGLFMVILKGPQAAQSMGLISLKAQIVAGSADWETFFDMLNQVLAMAGYIFFAFITTWLFGREFSDHTAKYMLALPTRRSTIIISKFFLAGLWILLLTLLVFVIGFIIGVWVDIPGWSLDLTISSFRSLFTIAILSVLLMPFVALFASAGHGYLPALGWAFGSFFIAQIINVLGWGDWFPWSVPALISGMFGPQGINQVGAHSILLTITAFALGIAADLAWWQFADQTH